MKNTDIMIREINNDLSLSETWREKMYMSTTEKDREYYRGAMYRSIYKAEAKEELIRSLGYTLLFDDDRKECISIYPIELDD